MDISQNGSPLKWLVGFDRLSLSNTASICSKAIHCPIMCVPIYPDLQTGKTIVSSIVLRLFNVTMLLLDQGSDLELEDL